MNQFTENQLNIERLRALLNIGAEKYESLNCDTMLKISQELDKYILIEMLDSAKSN